MIARALIAASFVAASCLPARPVEAQSGLACAVDVAGDAAALRADDDDARAAAAERLGHLPFECLGATREQLDVALRRAPDPDTAEEALHALRRATGSRRADDIVDLSGGAFGALSQRHDAAWATVVELVLLARSLERLGTPEAMTLLPEVLRAPGDGWVQEGRRLVARLGDALAPSALRALSHSDLRVREWARWTVRRLELESPGIVIRRLPPTLLADALRAYGEARIMSAMPIAGSFVDADQRVVREAAFDALRSYGRNAVWVMREAYGLRAPEPADPNWGWERTLEALRERVEATRLEAAHAALAEAAAALEGHDAPAAVAALDRVLLRAPDVGQPETAALLGSAASELLASRDVASARRLFERALRLAPDAPDANAWRARLRWLDAEHALADGVLDTAGYHSAAALDPGADDLRAAAARYPDDAPSRSTSRASLLGAAALLSLLAAASLLSGPRSSRRMGHDTPTEHDTDGLAHEPPSTLPG